MVVSNQNFHGDCRFQMNFFTCIYNTIQFRSILLQFYLIFTIQIKNMQERVQSIWLNVHKKFSLKFHWITDDIWILKCVLSLWITPHWNGSLVYVQCFNFLSPWTHCHTYSHILRRAIAQKIAARISMSASFSVESVLLQGKSSTSSRPDGYSNEIMCNRHIFNIDRMAIKLRHKASVEIRLCMCNLKSFTFYLVAQTVSYGDVMKFWWNDLFVQCLTRKKRSFWRMIPRWDWIPIHPSIIKAMY